MAGEDKNGPADHVDHDGAVSNRDQEHPETNGSVGTSRREFFKSAAAGAVAATAAGQLLSDQTMAHDDRDRGDVLDRLERSKRDRNRRILLKGGIVLSMDPAVGDFMKADVLIEGKKIKAVGPSIKASNAIVVDASNTIVMPGFCNTHHHTQQVQARSYFADAYYFQSQLYPDYRRLGAPGGLSAQYTPEDLYLAQLVGSLTNLSHGTTTSCDFSSSYSPQHTDAAIEGFKESGLRAVFPYAGGQGNTAFPQDIHRIKAKYFSSDDQLLTLALRPGADAALWQLARALGIPIIEHLTGRALGAQFEALGIGPDCTFAHCMDLADSTWRKISDNGAKVSISSIAEPTVANGTPPFMEVQKYGLESRTSFSTDTETFMTADFFSQMRGAFTVQRFLVLQQSNNGQLATPVPITCRQVIEMATMGGARGSDLDHKVGSLTPGKEADIIMLRTDMINVWPITNVPGAIVTLMDTSNVDTVLVAGQVRKWNGRLVNVNLPKLLSKLEASRNRIFAAAGWAIEPFGTCCPRTSA